MAQPAQVASIETVDTFKASLVVYLDKAGRILDEANATVVRTRVWLEADRLVHWKNQVGRRTRELALADQELLTARLSGMDEAIRTRRMAADKARQALGRAEAGLDRVRHWIRNYETQVESPAKRVSQLRQVLASDMTRALAYLQSAVSTLAEYAGLSAPAPAAATGTPTGPAAAPAPGPTAPPAADALPANTAGPAGPGGPDPGAGPAAAGGPRCT